MRGIPVVLAALLGVGCAGSNGELGVGEDMAGSDLASTMEVKVGEPDVRLLLHVTNVSPTPIDFTFPSSQRVDFTVETITGERVWQWSSDMAFTQVVTEATLGSGETWEFEAEWSPGERSGRYEARTWLTARSPRVEQRTTFELP